MRDEWNGYYGFGPIFQDLYQPLYLGQPSPMICESFLGRQSGQRKCLTAVSTVMTVSYPRCHAEAMLAFYGCINKSDKSLTQRPFMAFYKGCWNKTENPFSPYLQALY
jgi:hypothetical protein